MATSNVQFGPLVRKMADAAQGTLGKTSGNVPVTMPGLGHEVNDPTQGDLAAIGMEEGYRNPLPNTIPYLQEPPLYGGAPTA